MQDVHISHIRQYIMYLQTHAEEYELLFNTILINVTEFFRDTEAWEVHIRRDRAVDPLGTRAEAGQIRVWSAGCSSGEEPYTIAMILCEAMGETDFKERVKIYATDVDDEALQRARQAVYSEQAVEGIPPQLLDRYFDRVNGSSCFRSDLRRMVIFGRNDLVQDAPISHIDFLICRNTFMYFNAATQARILARLHFALNESGFLFLGKAEMLVSHSRLFVPVDPRWRVFTKTHSLSIRERFDVMAEARTYRPTHPLSEMNRLRVDAFESGPIAEIVIENNGKIVLVNSRARAAFDLGPGGRRNAHQGSAAFISPGRDSVAHR